MHAKIIYVSEFALNRQNLLRHCTVGTVRVRVCVCVCVCVCVYLGVCFIEKHEKNNDVPCKNWISYDYVLWHMYIAIVRIHRPPLLSQEYKGLTNVHHQLDNFFSKFTLIWLHHTVLLLYSTRTIKLMWSRLNIMPRWKWRIVFYKELKKGACIQSCWIWSGEKKFQNNFRAKYFASATNNIWPNHRSSRLHIDSMRHAVYSISIYCMLSI